jgi:hypothetical protein
VGGGQPGLPMAFRHVLLMCRDRMIDWVTPRLRRVRPLSLIGPSAAPVAGGDAV